MADSLLNYKLQQQQVEVVLLTDPNNAELLKLKDDIGKDRLKFFIVIYKSFSDISFDFVDQLVQLQEELLKKIDIEQRRYIEPSSSTGKNWAAYFKEQQTKNQPLKIWKVGDKCMAKDATNRQ